MSYSRGSGVLTCIFNASQSSCAIMAMYSMPMTHPYTASEPPPRGSTRGLGQARVRTNQSTGRDRLRGWGDRTRTLMCREKIHLFDKSPELGFAGHSQTVAVSREDNLFC